MPNFNLPLPTILNAKTASGNVESGSLKLQLGQMYSARVESIGNQLSQLKVNIGQQTLTQPLPQLPAQVSPGKSYQVRVVPDKNGQLKLDIFPSQQAASAPQPQVVKIALSDSQLVNLLALSRSYRAQPDGSVQTEGQIVQGGKAPALKLPGFSQNVQLPEGLATVLKQSKTVGVDIRALQGKIELKLTLPEQGGATFKLTLPADKIIDAVRGQIAKTGPLNATLDAKTTGPGKVTLPNHQELTLPSKVQPQSKAEVTGINQRVMSVQISPQTQQSAATTGALASLTLDKSAIAVRPGSSDVVLTAKPVDADSKNAVSSSSAQVKTGSNTAAAQSTASNKPSTEVHLQSVKKQNDESLIKAGQSQDQENQPKGSKQAEGTTQTAAERATASAQISTVIPTQDGKAPVNLEQQKQILDKMIEPLIRLLLPKKLRWDEGFKALAALEKQLPENKTGNPEQRQPELKQLLNELRRSIPDQNSPLTEKSVATLVSQLINYSPTQLSTPTITTPTPGNAIANALQLLLGAKVVQSDAKVTPQLVQQLAVLLKPHTGKEENTGSGLKQLTANLAQAEQSLGSLKSLAGLSANIRHQQLENVEKRLDGDPQINISIPLKVNDDIKELNIRINEEEDSSGDSQRKTSIWQLNLTFDLAELGRMLVNARLKDGEVSMHLYAEKQGTLNQINKFAKTLEERMEFHGVKIKRMQSSLGKIAESGGSKKLNSLLQIKV